MRRVVALIADLRRDVPREVDVLGPVYVYRQRTIGYREPLRYRLVRVHVVGEPAARKVAIERLPAGSCEGLRVVVVDPERER